MITVPGVTGGPGIDHRGIIKTLFQIVNMQMATDNHRSVSKYTHNTDDRTLCVYKLSSKKFYYLNGYFLGADHFGLGAERR